MNGFFAGDSKAQLRRAIKNRRDALTIEERTAMSRAILARVVALDLYAGARMIMAYCAHGSEVMTDELIARAIADGKRVAVPRVVDSAACVMHPAEIRSLAELAPGAYGIREPRGATQCPSAEEIDMVLVPGIVFDSAGHRAGYGKGYYDRWLQTFSRGTLVGLAYDFQVVSRMPRKTHDVAVGMIVTEQKTITCDERGSTT